MKTILSLFFFLIAGFTYAQELNCTVTINIGRVESMDRSVFTTMEQAIRQFMNTRKWTDETFANHEKIKCSIILNINMVSFGVYEAFAQIISYRPIYNTNYETVLFNFADKDFNFDYIEFQPLDYNDNEYTSNLTSLLAYYAYVILALDYDSFRELSGNPYIQKVQQVINISQNSGSAGWNIGKTLSRYDLAQNLSNPQALNWRKGMYAYHRLGLDTYSETPANTHKIVIDVLSGIKELYDINPASVIIVLFFDTKANELVNIYSTASAASKRQAYNLLTSMDPKRTIYQKLISN